MHAVLLADPSELLPLIAAVFTRSHIASSPCRHLAVNYPLKNKKRPIPYLFENKIAKDKIARDFILLQEIYVRKTK